MKNDSEDFGREDGGRRGGAGGWITLLLSFNGHHKPLICLSVAKLLFLTLDCIVMNSI